jgi:5-methylcytosine-specific restriction endonuclease McrA
MSIPKTLAMLVFQRDDWHCRCCHTMNGLDPHHVVYKSFGGSDTLDNLLTLCRKCHDDIHGGRVTIEVVEKTTKDLTVKFWKHPEKGWKP